MISLPEAFVQNLNPEAVSLLFPEDMRPENEDDDVEFEDLLDNSEHLLADLLNSTLLRLPLLLLQS